VLLCIFLTGGVYTRTTHPTHLVCLRHWLTELYHTLTQAEQILVQIYNALRFRHSDAVDWVTGIPCCLYKF